jgi:hypothetical protein
VLLVEVPAARANLQRGDLVVEPVLFACFIDERQLVPNGLVEIDLALNLVVPLRAVRILEVGHVRVGARVEGVDHHLRFDRTGDFAVAAFEGLGQRGNAPVAFANISGFRKEVGHLAGVDSRLAVDARLQQLLADAFERTVQFGDQSQRVGRQNGFVSGLDGGVDFHSGGQIEAHVVAPVKGL